MPYRYTEFCVIVSFQGEERKTHLAFVTLSKDLTTVTQQFTLSQKISEYNVEWKHGIFTGKKLRILLYIPQGIPYGGLFLKN